MRKLSSDVYDQIKSIKAISDPSLMLEKERDKMDRQMEALKQDVEKVVGDLRYQHQVDVNTLKNTLGDCQDLTGKLR